MTTMTTERDAHHEESEPEGPTLIEVVHKIHDELELPEGYTAQIIKGQLVIMATPSKKHAIIVRRIDRALTAVLPQEKYDCYQNITGQEPEGDRFIPDLGVWPQEALEDDSDQWLARTTSLLLAVEVTSPGSEPHDYDKIGGYAHAGVPIYLIVDRKWRRCVLLTEPEPAKGIYQTTHTVDFGEPITIPLETPVKIETAEF